MLSLLPAMSLFAARLCTAARVVREGVREPLTAIGCFPCCLRESGVPEPVHLGALGGLPQEMMLRRTHKTSSTIFSQCWYATVRLSPSSFLSMAWRHQKRDNTTRKKPFRPDLVISVQDVVGIVAVGRSCPCSPRSSGCIPHHQALRVSEKVSGLTG